MAGDSVDLAGDSARSKLLFFSNVGFSGRNKSLAEAVAWVFYRRKFFATV